MSAFCGVEVLTYVVMSNHFHLLLRVPERAKFLRRFALSDGDAEVAREVREVKLLGHLKLLYSKAYLSQLEGEFAEMKEKGLDDLYEKTVQGYLERFCSLEHFMKELKERFSRWFNKRHGRKGTLWQSPSPKASAAKGARGFADDGGLYRFELPSFLSRHESSHLLLRKWLE